METGNSSAWRCQDRHNGVVSVGLANEMQHSIEMCPLGGPENGLLRLGLIKVGCASEHGPTHFNPCVSIRDRISGAVSELQVAYHFGADQPSASPIKVTDS